LWGLRGTCYGSPMTQTTTATYRLSTRRFCPTCGGKAQDPQPLDSLFRDDDGNVPADQAHLVEACDEPYHDPADEGYRED
jgi:hypothetical protein